VGESTERQQLLAFRVDGKARPKGSLTPVPVRGKPGKFWLKESSTDGPLWRRHVKAGAHRALRDNLGGVHVGWVTGFPTVLPVRVLMRFGFERIVGTKVEGAEHAPVSQYFGDLDKLIRNVLDALTDAGVYADDRQVTRCEAEKRYVASGEVAHTLIEVWEDW
jgi:hypothetical protein